MLTNFKFTTLQKGLVVLTLALGACSSSSPATVTGNGGHGGAGKDGGAGTGGAAGTTGEAGTGGAGTTGGAGESGGDGGAGTTGAAGGDGGAGTTGAAGGDGGLSPMAAHLMLINADTTGGVMITRAAPKAYDTCK